jgi:N6-L-threonylcarbamoyladenine synthase
LAGGVAANSALREQFLALGQRKDIPAFIPAFEFCTDNAAMIGIVGHFELENGLSSSAAESAKANLKFS